MTASTVFVKSSRSPLKPALTRLSSKSERATAGILQIKSSSVLSNVSTCVFAGGKHVPN